MCKSIGEKLVSGLVYLHDTNSSVEGGKLIWNKVPKWWILSLTISTVVFTLGLLVMLKVIPSKTPIVSGLNQCIPCVITFTLATIYAVKRYYKFKRDEKLLAKEVAKLVEQAPPLKMQQENSLCLTVESVENSSHSMKQITIPKDIINTIFSFLKIKDLVNLSTVCKSFYSFVMYFPPMNNMGDVFGQMKFSDWEELKKRHPENTQIQVYAYNLRLDKQITDIAKNTLHILIQDKLFMGALSS